MKALTGSLDLKREKKLTPFEEAEVGVLKFMVGLQTSAAFEELSERIQTLEAIMKLPVMHMSSSAESIRLAKKDYEQEMKEIELAIKLFVHIPGVPEA